MAGFKLITNVADFGLFRPLARSRGRLAISVLVSVAVAGAAAWWASSYILERSDSVTVNLLLITALMGTVLISAYLQAMLVGDLVFPGPWREQVLLGQAPKTDREAGLLARDHSAEFLIMLGVLMVANAAALDAINGGFLDRYHNEGFFQVRLRSSDPDERIAALVDLSEPLNATYAKRPAVQEAILGCIEDRDDQVRRRVLWTLGKLGVERAQDALATSLRDTSLSPALRAEAAIALGRLPGQDITILRALEAIAVDANADKTLRIGAMRGLVVDKNASAVVPLLPLLDDGDREIAAHAGWVLREIGGDVVRRRILAARDAKPAGWKRCVVWDVWKMVAAEEDIDWVRKHYNKEQTDERCEGLVWRDLDDTQRYVLYDDSYRVKLIKIAANAGAGTTHRHFFERIVRDTGEVWRTREVANEVLRMVDQAR